MGRENSPISRSFTLAAEAKQVEACQHANDDKQKSPQTLRALFVASSRLSMSRTLLEYPVAFYPERERKDVELRSGNYAYRFNCSENCASGGIPDDSAR